MRACQLVFLFFTIAGIIAPEQGAYISDTFDVTLFTNEIQRWISRGIMSDEFVKMIKDLAMPTVLQRLDWTAFSGAQATALCVICQSFARTIINLVQDGTPVDIIQNIIVKLCTELNLQTEAVCRGVVNINTPAVFFVITNDQSINVDDICALVLQEQSCSDSTGRYEWTVDINPGPPEIINRETSDKHLTLLQITDIHYDPLYEPGGNADCDEPTCCRKGQNRTGGNKIEAGYWGDFNNCDTPWHSVVEALDHMQDQHKNVDLIYFTGDIIDHGVWETSREGNTESIIKSFKKIKETFGDKPVYPILGNHEPHPLNLFAPSDVKQDSLSTRWLYELVAEIWIKYGWLPESTRNTILRGGFYTISPKSGFRLIVINNNVCYIYNWWLIYEPNDPSGQLKWLADTLLQAEKNEEFVHILGHIPAGANECQRTWSREYRRIINRFSHIISAQFNGHTHNDEFNVFYDLDDTTKLINMAWNGGSITPYAYLNPNYKIYYVNSNTYAVEDAETWMYNLTKANETPKKKPDWFKSYSFKNQYGLEDLSSESLNRMIIDMAKGAPTLKLYHINFFKHAAPELEKECDDACLQEYVCRIVTSSSGDNKECKYFQTIR